MSDIPEFSLSTAHPASWILPLDAGSSDALLPGIHEVGGKGANLARLAQAGFSVPPGFLIATAAYRAFVAENGLEAEIYAALPGGDSPGLSALEAASDHIRARFAEGRIFPALREALLDSYAGLGLPPVAVRSSSTAEDLPDMSFAGQQDTYLNVLGEESLLQAVVRCWSSLWTARAIGYRLRNGVPHTGAALAVVVQQMVQSQAAGVLFTANPLSGLRSETVIDATLGLGEALVSGQVEPDHYVVDLGQERIVSKALGAKALSVRGRQAGGTEIVHEAGQERQALPDTAILELARLGRQAADLYGVPQDIEWAWADERLYLLQSRPITSLYPLPESVPPEPLKVFFSFAAVQGMLDPITPLGQDTLRQLFAAGTSLFGFHYTPETQVVLYTAGERLWVNFTALMRNSIGRRIAHGAFGFIEPTVQQALFSLWDDPRLQPARPGIRLRTVGRLRRFFLPLAANVLLNLRSPHTRREHILANGEQVLEELGRRAAAITGDRYARLAQQADLLPGIAGDSLRHTLVLYISGVAAGMASFGLLNRLAASLPGGKHAWGDLVLEVTRGLPDNPTTQMDLDLWEVAQQIRQDPAAWRELQVHSPMELAARYRSGEMAVAASHAMAGFLEIYGGRGLAEIDLGRPRWQEDPLHIFEALSSYLQIEPGSQSPDAIFARGAETAQAAIVRLVSALRSARLGWLKARLARFFASRVRALMGMRESPKFFAVRMIALIRWELLKTGEAFVRARELACPDDLLYLTFAELRAFAAHEARDWRGLVAQRRENYAREKLRRQIPRLLLSDGRAFYKGISAPAGSSGQLAGSPVSPGSVKGRVRVVLDPRQANLSPGEILVCKGTDPSWTPLFLTAAGLVMEVGGMMTHGAVVAREYGIPAVVGVDQATTFLHTGQQILLDGSSGKIILLDETAV